MISGLHVDCRFHVSGPFGIPHAFAHARGRAAFSDSPQHEESASPIHIRGFFARIVADRQPNM